MSIIFIANLIVYLACSIFMISQNSIEQVLQVVAIEEIVADYVSLKRSGSRFKGCCPFHEEKTPSFIVSPAIGIYKCFGCQKGGNAIQFLMEIENFSFVESVRTLAQRYGIALIETKIDNPDAYQESQLLRESIQAAVDFAQNFFQEQLHDTEEGKTIGLPYFKERGYTVETVKKWGLGYSPEMWEALAIESKTQGFTNEIMLQAGLLRQRDNATHYDLFRYRVMFPICAVTGKVIGFAGRKMSSTDPSPKYVNSPETDLYRKSDVLYGLYQAKNAVKKSDKVYLTEGYTDVISLHQSGIENVVASSGTALTSGQIKLLKRFTDNVTVVYDGDAAGIKASLRGIDLLLEEGINVRVVPLPTGQDPDSFCQSMGGESFQSYLDKEEETFIFFKAKFLIDETNNDPLRKSDAVREILKSLALIADPLKRSSLSQQLAKICNIEESLLVSELGKLLRIQQSKENQEFVQQVKSLTENAGIDLASQSKPLLNDSFQELAMFRLLLLFADKAYDESQTVFDFIWGECNNDETIAFETPLALKLKNEIIQQGRWPGQQHFINHTDPDMAAWSAGVLADVHVLSPVFAQNFIEITTEEMNYGEQVIAMFLHLRRKKIDQLLNSNMELLKEPDANIDDLLLMIEYLNELKKNIAKKLGNAVSRI